MIIKNTGGYLVTQDDNIYNFKTYTKFNIWKITIKI